MIKFFKKAIKYLLVKLDEFMNWVSKKTLKFNPFFKFFGSIFPGIGAVILVFLREDIRDAKDAMFRYWQNPATHHLYRINYEVITYFFFILIWLISYFLFILNELNESKLKAISVNETNKKNIAENKAHLDKIGTDLNNAIHNAPNPEIFKRYKILVNSVFQDVQYLEEKIVEFPSSSEDGKIIDAMMVIYEQYFCNVLLKICDFTKEFSTKNEASYGANIMYYIHQSNATRDDLAKLKNEPGWIYFREWDVSYIRGVLQSIPKLIYTSSTDDLFIPPITLPIAVDGYLREQEKQNAETKVRDNALNSEEKIKYQLTNEAKVSAKKYEILLPSAVTAAVLGEDFVNTADIYRKDINNGLNDMVKKQAEYFFLGKGKNIKSVLSMSIPASGISRKQLEEADLPTIIGVLNIDCNSENLIGNDTRYLTTFYSFLRPIVYQFAPYLQKYLTLHKAKVI